MSRLLVHVEGETEESFVNEVLSPHPYEHGFSKVSARLIGNARQRDRRGGIRAWIAVRKDIVNHLREDRGSIATTMVDYYGLPQTGSKAWPGRLLASRASLSAGKAKTVEAALLEDIAQVMGPGFDQERFIPHVTMHEFEALLFSDSHGLGRGIGRPELAARGKSHHGIRPSLHPGGRRCDSGTYSRYAPESRLVRRAQERSRCSRDFHHGLLVSKFQEIRDGFDHPEEIDDSPETAPSKRVSEVFPEYQKPLMGTLAVLEIGLEPIRDACPHFRSWLDVLHGLPHRRHLHRQSGQADR